MFHSVIEANGAMYLLGGSNGREKLNDVWVSTDGRFDEYPLRCCGVTRYNGLLTLLSSTLAVTMSIEGPQWGSEELRGGRVNMQNTTGTFHIYKLQNTFYGSKIAARARFSFRWFRRIYV